MKFDPAEHPHRRQNLLTGEWLLVSPHRARRPWQGDVAAEQLSERRPYAPDCYLCPGNVRAGGVRNPDYRGPYVFDNDFAALLPESSDAVASEPLFPAAKASGAARVVCFSEDHAKTLPDLDRVQVRRLIDCLCDQSRELGALHAHVQVFENKGAAMGCSSPHPHGQIWASDFVPQIVARESACQRDWLDRHGTVLLDAVASEEAVRGTRVVEQNEHWLAIVPWWAAWPFETLLIARTAAIRLEELDAAARDALAVILRQLTGRYDDLFGTSFPYSMGWHGAPHGVVDDRGWRLHAHFYPPLLRSASVRKFMVGFEMLAEAQRDLTPEQAAARLRDVPPREIDL